jgi:hypothetical protein
LLGAGLLRMDKAASRLARSLSRPTRA